MGWGILANPWLTHVNVWQKPLQYCKVISLQLIKINEEKKKELRLKIKKKKKLTDCPQDHSCIWASIYDRDKSPNVWLAHGFNINRVVKVVYWDWHVLDHTSDSQTLPSLPKSTNLACSHHEKIFNFQFYWEILSFKNMWHPFYFLVYSMVCLFLSLFFFLSFLFYHIFSKCASLIIPLFLHRFLSTFILINI